jgi:hypothetical protein
VKAFCPVCKGVTTSSETCTSCSVDLLSCAACGGLNVASNQACLVCGERLASRLPLGPASAIDSPRSGAASQAAVDVQACDPQVLSERLHAAPLSNTTGTSPALTPKKGALAGVARGCQIRQEAQDASTTLQILAFRLDRFDGDGRPLLPSIPVEMRGLHLKGGVNDGEWVEIPGTWKPDTLLEPKRVRNLTTGSWVKVSGRWLRLFQVLFFLLFLAIALFLFWEFYTWGQKQFNDFGTQHSQ